MRTTYKGYTIDRDNLNRLYIYNTASPYSEDSDRDYNCGNTIKEAKQRINQIKEAKAPFPNLWRRATKQSDGLAKPLLK